MQTPTLSRRHCLSLGAALALPGCSSLPSLQNAPPVALPGTHQIDIAVTGRLPHTHRIMVAVPPSPPPPAGYAVLYVLDGNLLFAPTAQLMRNRFARGPEVPAEGAVVVGLGYATDQVADLQARTYDYTPPAPGPETDERGRLEGGADAFLDFVEQRVRPAIARSLPIDPQRQTLFGHSYGGLCVLHALFTRPGGFQNHVAASPSVWWRNGFVLQEMQQFLASSATGHSAAPLQLLITQGERETRPPPPDVDAARAAVTRARRSANHLPALLAGLRSTPAVQLQTLVFAGADHGSAMLPAAQQALALAITGKLPAG